MEITNKFVEHSKQQTKKLWAKDPKWFNKTSKMMFESATLEEYYEKFHAYMKSVLGDEYEEFKP